VSEALIVPDPRSDLVPRGWWEHVILPATNDQGWDGLDDFEERIGKMASVIEAMGGDAVEFEKALRVVDYRRGVLLGQAPHGGDRRSNKFQASSETLDVSEPMRRRYRLIAEWWDRLVYPWLSEHDQRKDCYRAPVLRRVAKVVNAAKLDALTQQLTQKDFSTLYDVAVIDPPWPIEKIERDVREFQADTLDYPTMPLDVIQSLEWAGTNKALPLRANAFVWLWTTQRFLPPAIKMIKAWGLKYGGVFVWHKSGGFQPVGQPQYNCEFVVWGRNGSPRFQSTKGLKMCFSGKRGAHSEKPLEFYEMIEAATTGHRIDIFNRRTIRGFDGWGLEANGVAV
jgi:N6-adenosine-specific RNA methylase IME4